MKKLPFLILLAGMLFACAGNEYEQARQTLIGSWRYDVQSILDTARAHQVSEAEMAMVEGIMSIYKDAVFEFREDSTLIVVTNGLQQDGVWALAPDGKQLYLNLSGPGKPNEILELAPDRLTLAPIPEMGLFYKRIFIPAAEGPAKE